MTGFLFTLPALVGLGAFFVVPFRIKLKMSLSESNGGCCGLRDEKTLTYDELSVDNLKKTPHGEDIVIFELDAKVQVIVYSMISVLEIQEVKRDNLFVIIMGKQC